MRLCGLCALSLSFVFLPRVPPHGMPGARRDVRDGKFRAVFSSAPGNHGKTKESYHLRAQERCGGFRLQPAAANGLRRDRYQSSSVLFASASISAIRSVRDLWLVDAAFRWAGSSFMVMAAPLSSRMSELIETVRP